MPSSTALSAAIWRRSTWSSEFVQPDQDIVEALVLGELIGRRGATVGARDSSRASRSGGATKITVSLIGDGFGVPCVASGSRRHAAASSGESIR